MAGFVLHWFWKKIQEEQQGKRLAAVVEEAKNKAQEIVKNAEAAAHGETLRHQELLGQEVEQARGELRELEKRLNCKEENLNYRLRQLAKREEELQSAATEIAGQEKKLQAEIAEVEKTLDAETKELQKISGYTKEQAMEKLLDNLREETEEEAAQYIQKTMSRAKAEADRKACQVLAMAVQRCAVEHTANSVVATIDLPDDHMKGRIIGREGRNIRTFEKVSGVDVIVDDTPGVVVVSGFDPIRREIARRAMEKLILDGRIHPARIEEVMEDTQREMEKVLEETGKQAAYDLNIPDIHPREFKLIGKLKFQSVMGQNLLQHTIEIVHLVSMLAGELHLDIAVAKRCALLHDIGRALDHTYEGSHAAVGAEIAKRCQESEEVVNAIASHHEEVPVISLYGVLLQIAHHVSLDRPGAVKEHWERHLKRLERLENIALSFKGIESAYVVQAGREIRCIVNASKVSDVKAVNLCRNIARKIQQDFVYLGEIKIVVVRETRIIEYAK